jgi:hypothetical protein
MAVATVQPNLRSDDCFHLFCIGLSALRAIRDPIQHSSFLWFIVFSSITHGVVMLVHAVTHPVHMGHLFGDVWILAGGAALALPLWLLRKHELLDEENLDRG